MTKDELRIVAQWKAPRSAGHVEDNPEEYVKEITAFALGATTERARIEVLTNLDGRVRIYGVRSTLLTGLPGCDKGVSCGAL